MLRLPEHRPSLIICDIKLLQGACNAPSLALKSAESTAHQPELRAQRLPEPRALEGIAHVQHCSLTDKHFFKTYDRECQAALPLLEGALRSRTQKAGQTMQSPQTQHREEYTISHPRIRTERGVKDS